MEHEFNDEHVTALIAWLEDARENGFTLDDLISTLRNASQDQPVEA